VIFPVENHPQDSRVSISKDGKCQTLTGQMGTGGNNVPIYCIFPITFRLYAGPDSLC